MNTESLQSSRRLGGNLVLMTLVLAAGGARAKEILDRDSRFALIRGLQKEVGVAKVPLPRGKRGVFLDGKGTIDQRRANSELKANGEAIRPGMPVEITHLTFKSNRIVFEINGGGKRGKRWYERIEVGMGTSTRPIAPQTPVLAYGSWITLVFREEIEALTVAEAKTLLAGVLDFERHSPTVLYSPAVPPKIKEAIKNHKIIVGMDRDAVLSAKGAPDRKVREVRQEVEQEDWIYGFPPHVLFVTFDGDTVVRVHQY